MVIPLFETALSASPGGPWQPVAAAEDVEASDRVRRAGGRAGALWVTPPVKAAWCCQDVWAFRYAGDMSRVVASCECACVDRRGRALHGRGHPRWPTPGSDRG